mgnify:CR=1 FL=1
MSADPDLAPRGGYMNICGLHFTKNSYKTKSKMRSGHSGTGLSRWPLYHVKIKKLTDLLRGRLHGVFSTPGLNSALLTGLKFQPWLQYNNLFKSNARLHGKIFNPGLSSTFNPGRAEISAPGLNSALCWKFCWNFNSFNRAELNPWGWKNSM